MISDATSLIMRGGEREGSSGGEAMRDEIAGAGRASRGLRAERSDGRRAAG